MMKPLRMTVSAAAAALTRTAAARIKTAAATAAQIKAAEKSIISRCWMDIPVEQIEDSIRVSWGPESDVRDVIDAFSNLLTTAQKLAF